MVPIPPVFALARTRALARTSTVAALALLGLALPAARTSSASTPPRPAILALPRAMLGQAPVPVIVMMKRWSPTLHAHMMAMLHTYHAHNVHVFHLIPAVAATVRGSALPALFTQPGVRTIVLDQQHALPAIPDAANLRAQEAGPATLPGRGPIVDALQTVEPQSLALTRANVAQARGYTGAGVRVAVIDSGLDISQPDLRGVAATDAHGVPLRVDFTGTGLQDTVGHGTATASMIAAQGHMLYTGDNRTLLQVYPAPTGRILIERVHFRVRGMAPGVRLLSAKIFDTRVPNGGGFDSWIVRALEWAVDHHADVISESFGGLSVPSTGVDPVAEADEAAIRAGVTVVAADGNEGPGQTTISAPAAAPGIITLNETPVTPPGIARTVLPGGNFDITLGVRNDNGPNVAEGYIGYATTDTYSDVPLGQVRGSFGSTSITGSSVFTYTTGFVPPGTRLVVSSIAALRPAVPLDLSLADPSGFTRAEGQPSAISTGRTTLQVTVAAVGGELPGGAWSGTVTLRRPGDVGARPLLVGASYANALTPLGWLSFDHGLQNGRITGGQPLILLPGQRGALHASATVPLSVAPGTYHAHLFVDTIFGDQVATIPLTITVQAHTGTEPAGRPPRRAVAAWVPTGAARPEYKAVSMVLCVAPATGQLSPSASSTSAPARPNTARWR